MRILRCSKPCDRAVFVRESGQRFGRVDGCSRSCHSRWRCWPPILSLRSESSIGRLSAPRLEWLALAKPELATFRPLALTATRSTLSSNATAESLNGSSEAVICRLASPLVGSKAGLATSPWRFGKFYRVHQIGGKGFRENFHARLVRWPGMESFPGGDIHEYLKDLRPQSMHR
jgi:hypothetical protein